MRAQSAAPQCDLGKAASASTGNNVENTPNDSAAQARWQANADAAERRSISRIEASKNSPQDHSALERSAKSAHDAGRHRQRPQQDVPWKNTKWEWVSKPLHALRITTQRIRETCVCSMCGREFVPARSDARTCGSACRQKAYRQRSTEAGQ
jgi:hypothetical protein